MAVVVALTGERHSPATLTFPALVALGAAVLVPDVRLAPVPL